MKNFVDDELARRRFLEPEEVREKEKEALVDTGAAMPVMPDKKFDAKRF